MSDIKKVMAKENFNAVCFALFLLSGLLKAFISVAGGLSIDITLVTATLLCCSWLLTGREKVKKSQYGFKSLLVFLLFTLVILFSLTYTASSQYGYIKAGLWFTCILAFLFPIFNKINIKLFIVSIVLITIVSSAIYSVIFDTIKTMGLDERAMYVFSGTYLELAYFIGVSLFFCILSLLKETKSFIFRLSVTLIIIYLFFSLVTTGARGPLIFFLLSMLLYGLVFLLPQLAKKRFKKINILGFMFIFLLGILVSLIADRPADNTIEYSQQSTKAFDRIALLFSDDKGNSINTRVKYVEDSLFYINNKPTLGYGFGSYGKVTTGVDQKAYPHNILLESWFELGLLGLITIVLFLIMSILEIKKVPVLMFFAMFLMFNQMKSSNLADSRVFFGMLAMSFLIVNLNNRKNINS